MGSSRQHQIQLVSEAFFAALLAGDAKAAKRLHVPEVVWNTLGDAARHERLAAVATLMPELLASIPSTVLYDSPPARSKAPRSKNAPSLRGFTRACGMAFNARLQALAPNPNLVSVEHQEQLGHCASLLLDRLTAEEHELTTQGSRQEFSSAQALPAAFWMHVPAAQRERFFDDDQGYVRRAVVGTTLWEHGIALGWTQSAELGMAICDSVLPNAPQAIHDALRKRLSATVASAAAAGGPFGVHQPHDTLLQGWILQPEATAVAEAQFLARAQCAPELIVQALDWAQALSPIEWSKPLRDQGDTPADLAAASLNTVAWPRIPRKDKQERYKERLTQWLSSAAKRAQLLPPQADVLWAAASHGVSPHQSWADSSAPWAALSPAARVASFAEVSTFFCKTHARALAQRVLPLGLRQTVDFDFGNTTLSESEQDQLQTRLLEWKTQSPLDWQQALSSTQSFSHFFLTPAAPIFASNALSDVLSEGRWTFRHSADAWATQAWRDFLLLPALLDNGASAQLHDFVWAGLPPKTTARIERLFLDHELNSVRPSSTVLNSTVLTQSPNLPSVESFGFSEKDTQHDTRLDSSSAGGSIPKTQDLSIQRSDASNVEGATRSRLRRL